MTPQQPWQQPPPQPPVQYGYPTAHPAGYAAPQPFYGQPPYPVGPQGRPPRPGTATAAAVMTIVSSSLGLAGGMLLAIVGAAVTGANDSSGHRLNESLGGFLLFFAIFIIALGAGGLTLGILILKRSRVAAVITMVLSGLGVLASLPGLVDNTDWPPSAVSVAWSAAVLLLLLVNPSRRWLFDQ